MYVYVCDAYAGVDLDHSCVAVAPYFDCGGLGSPQNSALSSIMTPLQVFDACVTTMPSVGAMVSSIGAVARQFNLPLYTYESGQSLVETAVIEWGNGKSALS
jgi:hypothetical protein